MIMGEHFLVPRIEANDETNLGKDYSLSDVDALLATVIPTCPFTDDDRLVPLTWAAEIAKIMQGDLLRLSIYRSWSVYG